MSDSMIHRCPSLRRSPKTKAWVQRLHAPSGVALGAGDAAVNQRVATTQADAARLRELFEERAVRRAGRDRDDGGRVHIRGIAARGRKERKGKSSL